MLNDVTARTGKLLTYYKAYKMCNVISEQSLKETFPADKVIKQFSVSNDADFPKSYLKFLFDNMYSVFKNHRKHVLVQFYICELIYDLHQAGYQLTGHEHSLFRTLHNELMKFEPEEHHKDNAILANYYFCLALVCRWSLDLTLSLEQGMSILNSKKIAEQHDLLKKAYDLLKYSKKYAGLVEGKKNIFSDEKLGEVSRDEFLNEIKILETLFSLKILPEVEKLRKQKIKELFSKFAQNYKDHEEETKHIDAQREVLKNIFQKLDRKQAGKEIKILDIATGSGIIPCIIPEVYAIKEISKIIAIDFSKPMLEQAGKEVSNLIPDNKCQLKECDIEEDFKTVHSEIGEDDFDVVICSFVFAWLSDRMRVLQNIDKLMKNNGTLIIFRVRGKFALFRLT
jgi:ubiquinone/menaquinone biosynthesis C-methylase UbiE